MGWEVLPWYTLTDDFDSDFDVGEYDGTNVFFRDDDDRIFRTYFVDGRGDEALGGLWAYLDITALGRQESEVSPGATRRPRPTCGSAPRRVRRAGRLRRRPTRWPCRSSVAGPRGKRGARASDRPRRRGAAGGDPAAVGERGGRRAAAGAGLAWVSACAEDTINGSARGDCRQPRRPQRLEGPPCTVRPSDGFPTPDGSPLTSGNSAAERPEGEEPMNSRCARQARGWRPHGWSRRDRLADGGPGHIGGVDVAEPDPARSGCLDQKMSE